MRAVCRPGVGDDVEVADGLCFNCPLQEPEEQQAALAYGTPVEPEGELVQVGLQMIAFDRTLVGALQPPLGQAEQPVYAGQQLMGLQPRSA